MMNIIDAMLDAKLFYPKRRPGSREDFGDDATVGLYLRHRRLYRDAGPRTRAWGMYLGMISGLWVVGTMETMEMQPSGIEEYGSLDELKREWELD